MKLSSFRLRVALLSALLAGSALAGFGGVSWWLIYQSKLNRIDDGIRNQLMRESDRPRPENHWQPYARSLPTTFGVDTSDEVALTVENSAGKPLYQSPTWTAELKRLTTFPPSPPKPQQSETYPQPPFPPPDKLPPFRPDSPPPGLPNSIDRPGTGDRPNFPPPPRRKRPVYSANPVGSLN